MKHLFLLFGLVFFCTSAIKSQCTAELSKVSFTSLIVEPASLSEFEITFTVSCNSPIDVIAAIGGSSAFSIDQESGTSVDLGAAGTQHTYTAEFVGNVNNLTNATTIWMAIAGNLVPLQVENLMPFRLNSSNFSVTIPSDCDATDGSICADNNFSYALNGGASVTDCSDNLEGIDYNVTFEDWTVGGVSYCNSATFISLGGVLELSYTVENGQLIMEASGGSGIYEFNDGSTSVNSTGIFPLTEGCTLMTVTDLDNLCAEAQVTANLTECLGNFNGDEHISAADLAYLLTVLGLADPLADFDCDGLVDIGDLISLLAVFGTNCN